MKRIVSFSAYLIAAVCLPLAAFAGSQDGPSCGQNVSCWEDEYYECAEDAKFFFDKLNMCKDKLKECDGYEELKKKYDFCKEDAVFFFNKLKTCQAQLKECRPETQKAVSNRAFKKIRKLEAKVAKLKAALETAKARIKAKNS